MDRAYKQRISSIRRKYPTEINLQRYLTVPQNWHDSIDDHTINLKYIEYPVYGLSDKACGRIDYVFEQYTNNKIRKYFLVECKIAGANDLWTNLSSLKVFGYKALYDYDREKDGEKIKTIPSVLITKDALSLNLVFTINLLRCGLFVLYPDNRISSAFMRNLPGYKLNEFMRCDHPPEDVTKYDYRKFKSF